MLLAAFLSGLWVVAVPVVVAAGIERMAQRGERVYRARNRDHSTVPPIK